MAKETLKVILDLKKLALLGGMVLVMWGAWAAEAPKRVYSHVMEPRLHPDETRRQVRPPSRE